MNRGRLAIFSPDGPIEYFSIEQETVAIGRSTGNDLTLDRQGISRYHASITIRDGTAELRDLESVNGTYVDGLRIKPNQARILRGGEEVQIGDIRLIFYPTTASDDTVVTHLQTTASDYLSVDLEGPNIAVTPGAHGPATLTLKNLSQEKLHLSLQTEGVPKSWVRLDRVEFDLDAEQSTEVGMTIKPLRRSESTPGNYSVHIKITDLNGLAPVLEIQTRIEILQYNGYGVVLGDPVVTLGTPFKLYVHNQGNGQLPLRFMGADKDHALQYHFQPEQITLKAGERAIITGMIQAKERHWIGETILYEFDIISQSQSASRFIAPVSGKVQIPPRIGRSILSSLLIVPVVVALFLLALLLLGGSEEVSTPIPQIDRFLIAGASDALSTVPQSPLLIEWSTSDADWVLVEYESESTGTTRYQLRAGENQSHTLYLPDTGRYEFRLRAVNRDHRSPAEEIAVVVAPNTALSAQVFSAASGETQEFLYINAENQNLLIDWYVDESLLTEANTIALEINSAPPATINESVMLTAPDGQFTFQFDENQRIEYLNPITVRLTINGATVQSRSLPVVYPSCEVIGTVSIYDSDSPDAAVLLQLLPGEVLRINGRTAANWVRISLPIVPESQNFWGWFSLDQSGQDVQCDVALRDIGFIRN